MEAGSVEAFRVLRDDLRMHGAPERLVRAAARAMRDEIRHVRQTAALARRFGEEPIAPPPVPDRPARTFEAVALENAIEGCVRETYSALECLWQAHRAEDPRVRSTMVQIARDRCGAWRLLEGPRVAMSRLPSTRARGCKALSGRNRGVRERADAGPCPVAGGRRGSPAPARGSRRRCFQPPMNGQLRRRKSAGCIIRIAGTKVAVPGRTRATPRPA